MRNVDHCWHPGCVLHVLLCIVGQFYKRAIAVNVETQDQVDGINHFLKGVLKVYIRPPKIVKKDEVATLLKRPSFVSAEAGKVIAHLEDLHLLLNHGSSVTPK